MLRENWTERHRAPIRTEKKGMSTLGGGGEAHRGLENHEGSQK